MDQQTGNTTRKCPMCAEEILVDAKKCKHCGSMMDAPHGRPPDKRRGWGEVLRTSARGHRRLLATLLSLSGLIAFSAMMLHRYGMPRLSNTCTPLAESLFTAKYFGSLCTSIDVFLPGLTAAAAADGAEVKIYLGNATEVLASSASDARAQIARLEAASIAEENAAAREDKYERLRKLRRGDEMMVFMKKSGGNEYPINKKYVIQDGVVTQTGERIDLLDRQEFKIWVDGSNAKFKVAPLVKKNSDEGCGEYILRTYVNCENLNAQSLVWADCPKGRDPQGWRPGRVWLNDRYIEVLEFLFKRESDLWKKNCAKQ